MSGRHGRRVAIVGVGYSQVGRRLGLPRETLCAQASIAALDDAGLRAADLDGIAVYTFVSDYVSAFRIADMIGVPELEYFNTNVDGGAYAMAALTGAAAVASGSCDTCLTLRPIMQATATGASVARQGQESFVSGPNEFLAPFGSISGAQWAGMAMQRTMHEYGFTEQMFGAFAVSQREYAVDNPDALLRTPMTMDDYLSSRYINKPLRLFDCDYPVDSCSGLIFTTEERARDLVHRPVFIDAWAAGGVNPGDFHLVPSMPRSSTYVAARRMWTKTDLQPSDVQIAGLYDGFSFIALQWMEALGLVGEGESGPFVLDGGMRKDGRLPTNTDGGACNVGRRHGANFFIEVTRQLRGECGDRQIPGVEVGVCSNSVLGFSACALLTGG
jgi:acetyl-CoA acetyltransferase